MPKKISKKKRILLGIALLFILFVAWVVWANTAPELNYITVISADLPAEFLGYRIAHVSDLHNADMVDDLIDLLKKAEPDIIAVTGDLVDSYHPNIERTLFFMQEAAQIAPCYYVRGNHEVLVSNDPAYWEQIEAMGVTVLQNEKITVSKNGADITLMGIDDVSFYFLEREHVENTLSDLMKNEKNFTLLLTHRPEYFSEYANKEIDLALAGHAHGGQFRLPFVGGLFAPSQGIFPKYDSGLYKMDGSQMVVSRGIGNSSFPLRFNNRPEVILVELQSE